LHLGTIDALKFVQAEPDLATFAAPGVNTVVTYGAGLQSPVSFTLPDIKPTGSLLPSSVRNESGDGIVPVRSSLRSTEWAAAQQALSKSLVHLGYTGLPHAACFPDTGTEFTDLAFQCYSDVLNTINPPEGASSPTLRVARA